MIEIPSSARIYVCGLSGSGKTVLVRTLFFGQYNKVLFYDTKCENQDLAGVGAVIVRTPKEFADGLNNKKMKFIYQPIHNSEEDFDEVCRICYELGNITLIVDEASHVTTATQIEDYHKEIMQRGRSKGVGIINCTQRPTHTHNTLISEAEHTFIFKLKLASDIDKFKGFISKKYLDAVMVLPQYGFVYSNIYGVEEAFGPLKI